jgi:putative peptidoglycan lipid II flippase
MSANRSMRRFSAILISGALASKVLGFAREVMMAHVLGATLVADGFRAAMAAVLIPLAFLQNESVPAIMIPMHRQAMERDEAPRHLGALTIVVGLIAATVMVVVLLFGEWWVNAMVGGFSAEGRRLTLEFTRMMSLGMPASAILNVLAAGEIAIARARLTNIRASVLNIAVLAGIGLMVLTGDAYALACSFTIAFNALAVWGLLSLWRQGVISFAGITAGLVIETGADFFRRLRVLLAVPLAEQANVWVERLTASRLTTGAVASLDYARSLTESALLLISQPVGMAVLSGHAPKNIHSRIEALVRPLLALTLPATAFLVVFSTDIVRLVYFRGAFGEEALLLTSHALRGIAFGVWAATLGWILIRLLNGSGRNGVAAIVIVTAYLVNMAFNAMTSTMHAASDQGMLLLGLAEASRSLVLLVGVVLALEERRKILSLAALGMFPALLMAALGVLIQGTIADLLPRLFIGGIACLVCIAVAVVILVPAALPLALNRFRRTLHVKGELG